MLRSQGTYFWSVFVSIHLLIGLHNYQDLHQYFHKSIAEGLKL